MEPLAAELNEIIEQHAPAVMRILSRLGKELYFPKGILTQTAEANQKATRYNATIGEARELKHSMALAAIMRHLTDLGPDAVLPYAPSFGRADLRTAWREEIKEKNPSLGDTPISLPVVTAGITHGLSTVADMFVDPGDLLLVPDQLWENYSLIFSVKRDAQMAYYPLLDLDRGFDIAGFRRVLDENADREKLLVLFSFPNNPTGYSITPAEADAIRDALVEVAEGGRRRGGRMRRRLLRSLLRRAGDEGVAVHAAGGGSPPDPGHKARRRLQRRFRLGAQGGVSDLRDRWRGGCIRGLGEEDQRLHQGDNLQRPERLAATGAEGHGRSRLLGSEGREVRRSQTPGRRR